MAMEVADEHVDAVLSALQAANQAVAVLGSTTVDKQVKLTLGDDVVLDASMTDLRDTWEATSFALEMMQRSTSDVEAERDGLAKRSGPKYNLTYTPDPIEALAPMVDGAERLIKEEALERVNAVLRFGGRKRAERTSSYHSAKKNRFETNRRLSHRHKVKSSTDEGSMEAFSFFDRYDRGYIMANDLRLACADHGIMLDEEQGQQLLWRMLKPSISKYLFNPAFSK